MVRIRQIIVAAIIVTAALGGCKPSDPDGAIELAPLIDVIELSDVIKLPRVKVIDMRPIARYQRGHIPGAIQLWRTDIEDKSHLTRGIGATIEQLQHLLQTKGLASDDHIVIYDDKGNVDAARLWWLLKLYDHPNISLLNGGLREWVNKGFSTSIEGEETQEIGNIQLGPVNPHLIVDRQKVLSAIANEDYKIIDVRSPNEYSGHSLKSGAHRPGRIPKSVFLEYSQALDANDKFLTPVQLLQLVSDHDIHKADSIIVYCQSGVRSAHFTFVLRELLDFDYVANYDGSWIEWSHDLTLPVEIDSINITMN